MADRIIAALEYLDAHTSYVLQKHKHRSLGDIDSKYEVIDPTEVPPSVALRDQIRLLGIKRTNMSRQKTVDQILDEDRERVVQSARTRSAPSRKRISNFRPLTSSSYVANSAGGPRRRRVTGPHSAMTSSSTSLKKMAFTTPGVKVAPSDARDEVMEEIVNKPLTHTPAKHQSRNLNSKVRPDTTSSLPGRVVTVGCKSINSSLKRAQTFHGKSSPRSHLAAENGGDAWQKKPGPFATVKVTGQDMWVVSDSTPPSYFGGELNGILNGTESSKLPGWEEAADSVPREERKSAPRFERQLGAPPQFGPTSQWYSFAGKHPSKQQPILTSFTDEQLDDYYNIESRVSETLINQLQSNTGIRIGVNGCVVSDSMKVVKKATPTPVEGSEFGSETANILTDAPSEAKPGDDIESVTKDVSSLHSSSDKENRSILGDENNSNSNIIPTPEPEDKKFTLLRYVGVANGANPYLGPGDSSVASTGSDDLSALLAGIAQQQNGKRDSSRPYPELASDESIWKLLKGASPCFWISKEKWRRMREKLMRRRSRRLEQLAEENAGSNPLSWEEQLKQSDARIVETKTKEDSSNGRGPNGSLPVVFHKLLSYDQLPKSFVHLTNAGYRPHSVVSRVDKDLDFTTPTKGFESGISAPPRSARSRPTTINGLSGAESPFPVRPFTSQSHRKRDSSLTSAALDIGQLLRVSQDSLPNNTTAEEASHFQAEELSEEELAAVRKEATNNMKMTGLSGQPNLSGNSDEQGKTQNGGQTTSPNQSRGPAGRGVTLNSLPMKAGALISTVDIRPSVPKSSVPVSSLNLSELDENYNVINGPNPPSPMSPNRTEEIFDLVTNTSLANVLKLGMAAPVNTPKTPKIPAGQQHLRRVTSVDDQSAPGQGDSDRARGNTNNRRYGARSAASTLPRSNGSSPRNNQMQINADMPLYSPSRGFQGSPLASSRAGAVGKNARQQHGANVGKLRGPVGGVPINGDTRPGFIQISHPLHIPQQQRPSSAEAGKRNKIYDSYMRELSTRGEPRTIRRKGASSATESAPRPSGVVVKSLGGSSGKILPDHQGYNRSQTSKSSFGFSAQAGRRSGLAIAADAPAHPSVVSGAKSAGPMKLGLQGDTVRLNLDKNIHVIYRDLGLLKKNGGNVSLPSSPKQSSIMTYDEVRAANRGSRPMSKRSGESRSRAASAKSAFEDAASSHSVVTIPTADVLPEKPDSSAVQFDEDRPDREQKEATDHEEIQDPIEDVEMKQVDATTERPTSAKAVRVSKNLNEVADSGTQYNPPDPEPGAQLAEHSDQDALAVDVETKSGAKKNEDSFPIRMELETGHVAEDEPNTDDLDNKDARLALKEEDQSIGREKAVALETDITETNPVNDKEQKSNSLQEIKESDKEKRGKTEEEEREEGGEREESGEREEGREREEGEEREYKSEGGALKDRRSVSESHLDQIGKEDFEEEVHEDDPEVRGVTKVTVNIPPPSS